MGELLVAASADDHQRTRQEFIRGEQVEVTQVKYQAGNPGPSRESPLYLSE